MSIREQLEESQKVCSTATEGPWNPDRPNGDPDEVPAVMALQLRRGILRGVYVAEEVDQDEDATFISHARSALPLRNAQLAAVLRVHEPIDALNVNARNHHKVQVCAGCGQDGGNWNQWPCPTIRAIEDAAP